MTETEATAAYLQMLRIRMVEQEISARYTESEMRCPVHLSIGQEACAVGVCKNLDPDDWVFSGHRNHAHYLAKGGDLFRMVAEIYGLPDGCCGGRGGSMHLTDRASGFIASTPIVGSTVPIATGAALASRSSRPDRVIAVFFGEGAMECGVVLESINLASVLRLPVLFVCENNYYSVYSDLSSRQSSSRNNLDLVRSLGIDGDSADGNNILEVSSVASRLITDIRRNGGARFLLLNTYRWLEHCGPNDDDHLGYRRQGELTQWKSRDPIEAISDCIDISNLKDSAEKIKTEINLIFDKCSTLHKLQINLLNEKTKLL